MFSNTTNSFNVNFKITPFSQAKSEESLSPRKKFLDKDTLNSKPLIKANFFDVINTISTGGATNFNNNTSLVSKTKIPIKLNKDYYQTKFNNYSNGDLDSSKENVEKVEQKVDSSPKQNFKTSLIQLYNKNKKQIFQYEDSFIKKIKNSMKNFHSFLTYIEPREQVVKPKTNFNFINLNSKEIEKQKTTTPKKSNITSPNNKFLTNKITIYDSVQTENSITNDNLHSNKPTTKRGVIKNIKKNSIEYKLKIENQDMAKEYLNTSDKLSRNNSVKNDLVFNETHFPVVNLDLHPKRLENNRKKQKIDSTRSIGNKK